MANSLLIRTQRQILERYLATIGADEAEAVEYLRQVSYATSRKVFGGLGITKHDTVEDIREIARGAHNSLNYWLTNITNRRNNRVRDGISQYVAWKWLLGHPDADTFPGAHGKPPYYDARHTYMYLRDQMHSGEFDRLTAIAMVDLKGKMVTI